MNIIVIMTDSLRADHCSCYPMCASYNGRKVSMPNMERLAADGTVFEHAYSESLPTIPARTTLWTGRVGFPFRGWQPFEPSDYLLAEVLWDKGFTSALITDTYHMHKPIYNCGRGFDTVVWVRGQEYDPWIVDERIKVDLSLRHRLRGDKSDALWQPCFEQYLRNRSTFKQEEDWLAPRVTLEAIRWLEDEERFERMDMAYELSDWIPTPAAEAMYRNNAPLLAYIAGPAKSFTGKAHNFMPGSIIEKQLVMINNSRQTVRCRWR